MPRIGVSDFLASAGLADHPDHSLNASSCYSSHSQLPAALGPFAAAASPIFTASTFVQPKSSTPVVHSSFTSSHHEMEVLQTAVSAPGSRGPNISQFLGHDSSAQLKLSAATAPAVDGTRAGPKGVAQTGDAAPNPEPKAPDVAFQQKAALPSAFTEDKEFHLSLSSLFGFGGFGEDKEAVAAGTEDPHQVADESVVQAVRPPGHESPLIAAQLPVEDPAHSPASNAPQPQPVADAGGSNSADKPVAVGTLQKSRAEEKEPRPITCSDLQCNTPKMSNGCEGHHWHNFGGDPANSNVRLASSMCFCNKTSDEGPQQCTAYQYRSSATPEPHTSHPGTNPGTKRAADARENETQPITCADLRCDDPKFPDACEGEWWHNFVGSNTAKLASSMCYCDKTFDAAGNRVSSNCIPKPIVDGSKWEWAALEKEAKPITCSVLQCDPSKSNGKDECGGDLWHNFEGNAKKASSMCKCHKTLVDSVECRARKPVQSKQASAPRAEQASKPQSAWYNRFPQGFSRRKRAEQDESADSKPRT